MANTGQAIEGSCGLTARELLSEVFSFVRTHKALLLFAVALVACGGREEDKDAALQTVECTAVVTDLERTETGEVFGSAGFKSFNDVEAWLAYNSAECPQMVWKQTIGGVPILYLPVGGVQFTDGTAIYPGNSMAGYEITRDTTWFFVPRGYLVIMYEYDPENANMDDQIVKNELFFSLAEWVIAVAPTEN